MIPDVLLAPGTVHTYPFLIRQTAVALPFRPADYP
jgi:hypothetical protein